MPCQTCGGSGHNTATCTVRGVTTANSLFAGNAIRGSIGAHGDVASGGSTIWTCSYAEGEIGQRAAVRAANMALQTDAQKQYATKRK